MKNYKFPRRFEIEGLDPLTLKVQVVRVGDFKVYDNLETAEASEDLAGMAGPMADKIAGVWCIRFESWEANDRLSV